MSEIKDRINFLVDKYSEIDGLSGISEEQFLDKHKWFSNGITSKSNIDSFLNEKRDTPEGKKYHSLLKRINAMATNIQDQSSQLVIMSMKLLILASIVCDNEEKSISMVQSMLQLKKFIKH